MPARPLLAPARPFLAPARPFLATARPFLAPARLASAVLLLAVAAVTLAGCGGPPTPHISQPAPAREADETAGPPGSTASPGPSDAPAPGDTVAPSPTRAPAPQNTNAPPPAPNRPPDPVPAELAGTWKATVSGKPMTKVLRADGTYTETWDTCTATGALQVANGVLTLVPSSTTCTWGPVAYQYALNPPSTLTLTAGGLPQDYQRS